ncbi:glycosyltransferase [Bosea sp. MMO-172]|uniref:glycosyltransferase n=1 Tax=Bosea sp. MMO-172 TaxID=3127885 RepID=UPI00301B15C1
MSDPRIDVIIPVYNGARFLEEAVLSAVRQTLAPARILICDDGSTDATPEIAQLLSQNFPMVEHLCLAHGGEASARNGGLRAATGEYLAFLDADDVWMPSKLRTQMDVFAYADARVGVVHCGYKLIDEAGTAIEDGYVAKPSKKGNIFWDILVNDYAVSGSASAIVVRRAVLHQIGLFDERLFHGADADMWLRLAYATHFDYALEPLVALRIHGSSVQRRNAQGRAADFFLQQLIYYEKWQEVAGSDPAFRANLRKRALLFMLPSFTTPSRAEAFYKVLQNHSSPLARSLFTSRADLWGALAGMLGRYGLWRLRRVFLNDRSRFVG